MTTASNPWAALMKPLLRRPGDALPNEDMTDEELASREARRMAAWRKAQPTVRVVVPKGKRTRPLSTECFEPGGCGRRNCRVCNP